jgi:hypothetical protein
LVEHGSAQFGRKYLRKDRHCGRIRQQHAAPYQNATARRVFGRCDGGSGCVGCCLIGRRCHLRPSLRCHQQKNRRFPGLVVQLQMKPIFQKGLHHEAQLNVARLRVLCPGLDIEPIRVNPLRPAGNLKDGNLVSRCHHHLERRVLTVAPSVEVANLRTDIRVIRTDRACGKRRAVLSGLLW